MKRLLFLFLISVLSLTFWMRASSDFMAFAQPDSFGTKKFLEDAYDKKKKFDEKMKNNPRYQHEKKGEQYLKQRKYDDAVREFNAAIRLDPSVQTVYVKKGIALYMSGKAEQALPDFDRAVALNKRGTPWLHWPYLHKGYALMILERLDEAVASFDQSIRSDPRAGTYAARASIYYKKEQYPKALSDYNAAIKLDPNNPRLWNGKAMAHWGMDIEMIGAEKHGVDHFVLACQAMRKACQLGSCSLIEEFAECNE